MNHEESAVEEETISSEVLQRAPLEVALLCLQAPLEVALVEVPFSEVLLGAPMDALMVSWLEAPAQLTGSVPSCSQ